MDKKKSNAAASHSDKHGEEEKDENFLTKTAHTIRDKLHLKKKKKEKDSKSKSTKTGKTDSSSNLSSSLSDEDTPSKPTRQSPSPSGDKKDVQSKSSTAPTPDKKQPTGDNPKEDKPEQNNNDRVHLSFYGVSTVDDLLDRIDEAIESAKIVIEGDTSKTNFKIDGKLSKPRPTPADLEKKSLDKSDTDKNKDEDTDKNQAKTNDQANEKKQGEQDDSEPIRIDYKEIHRIEDILARIYKQPGNRKVVLENAPDNDETITVEKKSSSRPVRTPASTKNETTTTTTAAAASNDNDDSSTPQKSILKTSQDPSSLDTSTTVALLQDDQIHVNIAGVQNVNELLNRIDDALEEVSVILETTIQQKQQTPVENRNNNKQEGKDTVNKPVSSSSTSDKKTNEGKKTDKVE